MSTLPSTYRLASTLTEFFERFARRCATKKAQSRIGSASGTEVCAICVIILLVSVQHTTPIGEIIWPPSKAPAAPSGFTSTPAPASTALVAFDSALNRRHLDVVGVARHIDQCLMTAGIVEAERDQMLHTLLAHVAQGHWRAGRMLLRSSCWWVRCRRRAPTGKDMGLSMALWAYEFRSNERQRYIVRQCLNAYDLLVRTGFAEKRHRFCAKPADVPDIRRRSGAALLARVVERHRRYH